MLRKSLFNESHSCTFSSSALIISKLLMASHFLQFGLKHKDKVNVVSSAKHNILSMDEQNLMSFKWIKKGEDGVYFPGGPLF